MPLTSFKIIAVDMRFFDYVMVSLWVNVKIRQILKEVKEKNTN